MEEKIRELRKEFYVSPGRFKRMGEMRREDTVYEFLTWLKIECGFDPDEVMDKVDVYDILST